MRLVDAAASDPLNQIANVHGVLREIGARDVRELLLLNKTGMAPRDRLTASRRGCPHALPVSPLTGAGFEEARAAVAARVSTITQRPAGIVMRGGA